MDSSALYQRINLPVVSDPRGNLTFFEGNHHIPFEIRRVYYLYDIPGGARRAGHAHKKVHQLLVAISGSFDVNLDNGLSKATVSLNRPNEGLYVPPRVWRELDNFSSGAVCMAAASEWFDEDDYHRDYQQFLEAITKPKTK